MRTKASLIFAALTCGFFLVACGDETAKKIQEKTEGLSPQLSGADAVKGVIDHTNKLKNEIAVIKRVMDTARSQLDIERQEVARLKETNAGLNSANERLHGELAACLTKPERIVERVTVISGGVRKGCAPRFGIQGRNDR